MHAWTAWLPFPKQWFLTCEFITAAQLHAYYWARNILEFVCCYHMQMVYICTVPQIIFSFLICHFRFLSLHIKPVTDEQVFYDKFLCDKFYLLVCTRNFDNFFYDKCTCHRKNVKVQILFVCMGQQRKLIKVIWAFDVIGQRTIIIFLSWRCHSDMSIPVFCVSPH